MPFLRSLLAFAYGWHVAAFDTFDTSIYHLSLIHISEPTRPY